MKGVHIFHKWNRVKRSNKYRYQECDKCGKRRVIEAFNGGHPPVDTAWLNVQPTRHQTDGKAPYRRFDYHTHKGDMRGKSRANMGQIIGYGSF